MCKRLTGTESHKHTHTHIFLYIRAIILYKQVVPPVSCPAGLVLLSCFVNSNICRTTSFSQLSRPVVAAFSRIPLMAPQEMPNFSQQASISFPMKTTCLLVREDFTRISMAFCPSSNFWSWQTTRGTPESNNRWHANHNFFFITKYE